MRMFLLISWLCFLEKRIWIYPNHTLCSQSSASLRSATPDCHRKPLDLSSYHNCSVHYAVRLSEQPKTETRIELVNFSHSLCRPPAPLSPIRIYASFTKYNEVDCRSVTDSSMPTSPSEYFLLENTSLSSRFPNLCWILLCNHLSKNTDRRAQIFTFHRVGQLIKILYLSVFFEKNSRRKPQFQCESQPGFHV